MRHTGEGPTAMGVLVVIVAVLFFVALAILEVRAGQSARRAGDASWAAGEPSWAAYTRAVQAALVRNDLQEAERAWQRAHIEALGVRGWAGLASAGDAAVRIAVTAGAREVFLARARQDYLTALFRARREGAVDGVLRVGEAFEALGDRAVAEQCARTAEELAERSRSQEAIDRARRFHERLSDFSLARGDVGLAERF